PLSEYASCHCPSLSFFPVSIGGGNKHCHCRRRANVKIERRIELLLLRSIGRNGRVLQFLEFAHLAIGFLYLALLAIQTRESEVRLGGEITLPLDFNYLA